MSSKKVIIIVIIFVIIGGIVVSRDSIFSPNADGRNAKPSEAPPISLMDYDGNLVESKDYKGKIIVANAWASWCPFCVNELPEFIKLQESYPDEIVVVAINRAEPNSISKDYLENANLLGNIIFLTDPKDSFYKSIGGFSMPETIFVGPKGKLRLHKRAPMEFEEMEKIVQGILAEN